MGETATSATRATDREREEGREDPSRVPAHSDKAFSLIGQTGGR